MFQYLETEYMVAVLLELTVPQHPKETCLLEKDPTEEVLQEHMMAYCLEVMDLVVSGLLEVVHLVVRGLPEKDLQEHTMHQLLEVMDLVVKHLMEKKGLEQGLWVPMELRPQVLAV
jgi:hypothetical protein